MQTLYILGNGFDLHYGLHTSYNDMAMILATKRVYNEITNAKEFFEGLNVINWKCFEEELAAFDIEEFFGDNVQYPDYLSDHEYDRDGTIWNMQDKAESLRQALDESLNEMVNQANSDLFKIHDNLPFSITSNDAVLSFNYTSTFEYLCEKDIPILHIHGLAENYDNLIYGYLNPKQNEIKNNEEDYYIEQQEEAVNKLYADWKKPLQKESLGSFLSSWIEDVKGIHVVKSFGHGMGSVDLPYMYEIDQILKPAKWYISYHEIDNDYWYKKNSDWSFKDRVELFRW